MRQGVCRPHRQDTERDLCSCQHLNNVMNCPVAAAGKDCVCAERDRSARLVVRMLRGIGGQEFCFDAAGAQNLYGGLQMTLPPPASARLRVIEQGRLAHTGVGFYSTPEESARA